MSVLSFVIGFYCALNTQQGEYMYVCITQVYYNNTNIIIFIIITHLLVPVPGLKTAMVEKYDFSAGTSSRSTKLIHGGVRYLEKAIKGLDLEQYRLVKEALHERANLLEIAPHLSSPLPIMLPVYK